MAEQQISRAGDNANPVEQQNQGDPSQLTLTGICAENGKDCRSGSTTSAPVGDDNYIYFGGTEADRRTQSDSSPGEAGNYDFNGAPRNEQSEAHERYSGGTKVTLRRGDTFWKLAEEKYHCKYPIEAIYAANGLYPSVTEKNGKLEMKDPVYYAGKAYILPDEKDIERLTKQYRERVEQLGKHSDKRVGQPDEETKVKLIYGDTFSRLAKAKYDKAVPMEAIYEANGLTPKVATKHGKTCVSDPIYYAGREYKLPAEKDIPELTRRFWDRVGHPEKCPPEYRGADREPEDSGNYSYDGRPRPSQPERPRPPRRERDCPPERNAGRHPARPTREEDNYRDHGPPRERDCPPERGGGHRRPAAPDDDRYRDHGPPRERDCPPDRDGGYRRPPAPDDDRYRDYGRPGDRHECECGGQGCDSCEGRPHRREHECDCGGQGCESCEGRRRRPEHECDCGGRGCDSCEGRRRRPEHECDCGGQGCDSCGGRRRRPEHECDCGGEGCESCDGGRQRRRRETECNCGGSDCDSCRGIRRRRAYTECCGGSGCDSCWTSNEWTYYGPPPSQRRR